jgi:hypothetical protein
MLPYLRSHFPRKMKHVVKSPKQLKIEQEEDTLIARNSVFRLNIYRESIKAAVRKCERNLICHSMALLSPEEQLRRMHGYICNGEKKIHINDWPVRWINSHYAEVTAPSKLEAKEAAISLQKQETHSFLLQVMQYNKTISIEFAQVTDELRTIIEKSIRIELRDCRFEIEKRHKVACHELDNMEDEILPLERQEWKQKVTDLCHNYVRDLKAFQKFEKKDIQMNGIISKCI